jgi:tetratricopeptide (TPR) repeat protein
MRRRDFAFIGILCAAAIAPHNALALSMDQAMARCKEQVRPQVRACVRRKVMERGGSPERYIEECKAPVLAQVRDCVARLIGAEGFKQNTLDNAKPDVRDAVRSANIAAKPRLVAPRTIADITAILDGERPDPARLKKMQEAADANPPPNLDPVSLAHFYYNRSVARAELGNFREAIADSERAVELATGKVDQLVLYNFRTMAATQYHAIGEPKPALGLYARIAEDGERTGQMGQGTLFTTYTSIVQTRITLGDFDLAQTYVIKLERLWKNARSIGGYQSHAKAWEASTEMAKARLAEARGQLEAALSSYQRAELLMRAGIAQSSTAMIAIPRSRIERVADQILLSAARVKSRQGRIAEAEADARRALLNRLRATGKYNPATAHFILALASLLVEQGRYDDAKRLIASTITIYRELGLAEGSQTYVSVLESLASVQALEGNWADAAQTRATIDLATQSWEAARREAVVLSHGHIETLYQTGRIGEGLVLARRLVEVSIARFGEQNPETALARGHYAAGLARTGSDMEALKEFRVAIPQLTTVTFNTDNDDIVNAAVRTRYTQLVAEGYLALLGRARGQIDAAGESFRVAEAIRGRSVQKALAASSARMSVKDPALVATVRQEQDLRQQIGTQIGALNALLALPAVQRDDAGVSELSLQIEKLRTEHARLRAEIDRRFPDYADLIDPKPPTIEQIKDTLRPGEALLSFYFGRDASFAWARCWSRPNPLGRMPKA